MRFPSYINFEILVKLHVRLRFSILSLRFHVLFSRIQASFMNHWFKYHFTHKNFVTIRMVGFPLTGHLPHPSHPLYIPTVNVCVMYTGKFSWTDAKCQFINEFSSILRRVTCLFHCLKAELSLETAYISWPAQSPSITNCCRWRIISPSREDASTGSAYCCCRHLHKVMLSQR